MWCISADGSFIFLHPMASYNTKISCHLGDGQYLYALDAGDSGSIHWTGSFDDSLAFDVLCAGDVTAFASAIAGYIASSGGGTTYMRFVEDSGRTVTGSKYRAENGGRIIGPSGGFPGDAAGTVESSTYSWYKE